MTWLRRIAVIACMIGLVIGHGSTVLAKTELDAHANPPSTEELTAGESSLEFPAVALNRAEDCADPQSHGAGVAGHSPGSCHTPPCQLPSGVTLLTPQSKARPMMPSPNAEFRAAESGVELPPPRLIIL